MSNAAPAYPPDVNPPPKHRSGLVYLRDHVESYFREWNVPAMVAPVGLKYRTFQLNQAQPLGSRRICFIPGEFDGTLALKPRAYGSLSKSTRNATSVVNPREIAEWARTFTLSVWAAPTGYASDEQEAIESVDDLLEQTIRAVNSVHLYGKSASASVRFGEVTLVSPPNENSYGIELLVACELHGPLYDVTLETVQAGLVLPQGTFT